MAEPFLTSLSEKIVALDLQISEGVVLETKHFFSGAALYANGKICASLTPAGFGVKLPATVRDRLFKRGEGSELRYFEKAPVKKDYAALSKSVTDDPGALRPLLELSIGYVTDT